MDVFAVVLRGNIVTIDEFIVKAIKVPFVDKGREYSGWDCWGSVCCFYRDVKGVILPQYLDYDSSTEYRQLQELISKNSKKWQRVEKPDCGDVAVFNLSGMPCHTAVVVDGKMAIHAEKKAGTFLESLKSPIWEKRIEGFYRHE